VHARPLPVRRLVQGGLLVAAAACALSLGGPDVLVPAKDVAGAAVDVGVGFVIDFGGGQAPVAGCVQVPPSDNGYDALTAFLAQEHLAAPTYNASDLLCSIDGVPAAPACGQAVPGGYQYWSYWTMTDGSGSWTYASRGASVAVGDAAGGRDVEGWRFQNPGPDNPSAPAPRTAPDFAALCGDATSTPATTAPAPAPAASGAGTVPTAGGATASGPPSGGTSGGNGVTAPAAAGAGGGSAPSTTVAPSGAQAGRTGGASTSTTAPASSPDHLHALGATPVAAHQGGGAGALPLVLGGALALALLVVAAVRWRARARTR
jgi:hypothetical protein